MKREEKEMIVDSLTTKTTPIPHLLQEHHAFSLP